MPTEPIIQGRRVGAQELVQIRTLLVEHPSWHRTRLSRELCARWGWHNDAGRPKDMACRSLLLKLQARGLLELPPRQRASVNHQRNHRAAQVAHAVDPLHAELEALRPVSVALVPPGSPEAGLFHFLLQRYHYLGQRNCVGENLKYLVRERHGRPVACLLFGSAAWQCQPRDAFIGWTPQARRCQLPRLTNNTRFLILPWVRVPHLASHILSRVTRCLSQHWQDKYGHPEVIALRPEFITPQDGHTKQDCELAAAKRWLEHNAARYHAGPLTLLGDDLYSHQPFCRRALLHDCHFLFVCKPDSHPTLYDWVNLLRPGPDLGTLKLRLKAGSQWHTYTYRWANQVPLAEGQDALKVNWCEVTVTDPEGKVLYLNAWITDWPITERNVEALAASGRARWKIENENNNTLKTKGYHLEHNFGHGQQHLSALLAAMNILAFLFHTVLGFTDEHYRLIRASLPTRKTFFQDLRALTRYLHFPSWEGLLRFMMRGLEIGPYAKPT